ncbi:MAG: nodulation protein NfeD, partial [Bdellovibrionaceae bacterium]|nr:nodulation protein NfeD [Pseudobdellovibrionaceae bacterium]
MRISTLVLFFTTIFLSVFSYADCTLAVNVKDGIGAGTLDLLSRAEEQARAKGCGSLLIRLNTPGGSLQSTRLIVEKILSSELPWLCLVTPDGAHAGSAGAIIHQACHVNGGLPTTNVGAATPVSGGGQEMGKDLRAKMINDTVSWLEGVSKLRGRNTKFSRAIVEEAKAYNMVEAHKMGAVDFVVANEAEFLAKASGRRVKISADREIQVRVGEILNYEPDLRAKVLNFISDPELAYLIFMASLGLLYVELTNPGLIAPGVAGVIGLVLSLMTFHKLEIVWGALGLILLGLVFLVAELFVPSFGALGIGGFISFVVGSVLLFDSERTGVPVPWG